MRLKLLLNMLILIPLAANAQTTRAKCQAIAPNMINASDGLASMATAMTSLDYTAVIAEFGGEEAEHFRRLDEAQRKLMPVLKDYLSELEATALALRACAR